MIVTNEDRVLCEECYRDNIVEQDPGTHYFNYIKYGKCADCQKEVTKNDTKK